LEVVVLTEGAACASVPSRVVNVINCVSLTILVV
jgi:hypothetical protein